ncbi:patatin [candidate division KSB1 bacterium]|nr:MAG: patatin [candidate division KSB1 bacterium]
MKKILSIDGGGIKGVFPASFLSYIEDKIDGRFSEYFDLIVGTSTGGIIALGLGLGFSAKDILKFYKRYGPSIFGGNRLFKRLRNLFYAKYDHRSLHSALKVIFGDRKLGESLTRIVVPSFDLDTGKVYIHKTAHHERFSTDYKRAVVDVAISTSAAPTYFPAHLLPSGSPLVDGGIWANNPVGFAVVEAIGVLKWPASDIRVLSIGCTNEPIGTGGTIRPSLGLSYWGFKAIDLFMHAQDSASFGIATILTSHDQIKRISPVVSPRKYRLDSYETIPSLEGLGENYARYEFSHIRDFFSEKVEPFVPNYLLTNEK